MTTIHIDWTRHMLDARIGAPYVYGGTFSPTNTRQGCDCSALAAHILNGVLYGPEMTWQRIDPASGAWITTESWRPLKAGQRGPFGTITAARWQDIPADAPVKLALHHGPGGGANSHMWCEMAGERYESAGGKGFVKGSRARAISDAYAHDWAYLPTRSGAATLPPAPPAAPLLHLGSTGDRVRRLQHGLRENFHAYAGHLAVSGRYDAATEAAVREFQRRTNLDADGIVGPLTTAKLAEYGITLDGPAPRRDEPGDLSDRELLEEIWRQLRGPTGTGWPQLGHRTLVDGVARLLNEGTDI